MKESLINYIQSGSELTAFVFWVGYFKLVIGGVVIIIRGIIASTKSPNQ